MWKPYDKWENDNKLLCSKKQSVILDQTQDDKCSTAVSPEDVTIAAKFVRNFLSVHQ